MEILGYINLTIFITAMLLMLFRKLNFPVQTVLIAVSLLCLVVGAAFRSFTEGWVGVILLPNEMIGGIILHPITALLAGLFLAGALTASGGFGALKILINKLRKTPIGLVGTLVILIQLPVIASLPCGRIIGAALLPLLFAFGFEGGMGLLTKAQLIVLIGSFARNAFGSCGPSPIGGVGQIGEGFLGAFFPTAAEGILRAPQAFSLMLGTAITALFLKLISMKLYPNDVSLRDLPEGDMVQKKEGEAKGSFRGYLSLVIFLAALLISVFQPFGKMPVQTVLVAAGILMIFLCRITIQNLMGGIILLPVSAMAAGFMAAGALAATGGFNALGNILRGFSNIPFLGVAGMLAIFVQIQTILPLSCSRILTAALVPVLYLFGPAEFNLITWPQLAIVMAAYMINATTSCGPSPLGGAGMMAEGTMRAETGYIKGAFTFSSMAVMAPLAAIYMKFLTLSSFPAPGLKFERDVWMILGFTVVIFAVSVFMIKFTNIFMSGNLNRDWRYQLLGFVIPGAIGGAILAFCLYETALLPVIQGTVGGMIASLVIGLMVPKRLGPTETL
ncbi:MAG: hypothetical protein Q7J12_03425 [Syntrophales bacterium]|nr:hypothetical protein [Syntrophales bacterium]